jgi:hypothetical protein
MGQSSIPWFREPCRCPDNGLRGVDDVDYSRRINQARKALNQSNLHDDSWAVDHLEDGRYCLLRIGGAWTGGFFERGTLRVEFQETKTDVAVQRFVAWASKG